MATDTDVGKDASSAEELQKATQNPVANLISVLDPELVVFNGGVVRGSPQFLLATVEKVVRKIHPRPPAIQLSTLGDKAQLWGAIHTLLNPEQEHAIRA